MLKIPVVERLSSHGKPQQAELSPGTEMNINGQGRDCNTRGNYICWNELPKDIFGFEPKASLGRLCFVGGTAEQSQCRDLVQGQPRAEDGAAAPARGG